MENIIKKLDEALPPIIWRNRPAFKEEFGINPRTMANLDSLGQGPRERVRQGQSVGYPKEAFLEWFRGRLHTPSEKKCQGGPNE